MADVEVKDINLQPVASPAYYVGVDGTGKAIRVAPVVIPVQSVVGLTGTISQADLRGALGLGAAAYVGLGTTVNDAAYGDHTHTPASIGAEPSYGTGTASQYLRGDKTWQTLNKAAVGLSAVDNTADADKPISTSTQTALNGKEPSVSAGTTAQYWRGDKTWQPFPAFQPAVQFKDEGSNVGTAGGVSSVNFTGAGVSASAAGGELTVTITSGGGSGTVTSVSATAPAAGMSVSVANSTTAPALTFALADDLAAVEGISSTGFVRRTGSNTWTASNAVASDISDSTTVGQAFVKLSNPSAISFPRINADNTVSSLDASSFRTAISAEASFAAGTSAQYYRGDKTWQTLDKSSVGLSNVDNTTDVNKPVSTATQTALNGKNAAIQFKKDAVDYGSLGAVAGVTFTGSGVSLSEAAGVLTVSVSGGGGGGSALTPPTTISVNTTLAVNAIYKYTAAGLTLTLPASPANGDVVIIINAGTSVNGIVGRNGKTIMGLAENLTLDMPMKTYVLTYCSAETDWTLS